MPKLLASGAGLSDDSKPSLVSFFEEKRRNRHVESSVYLTCLVVHKVGLAPRRLSVVACDTLLSDS